MALLSSKGQLSLSADRKCMQRVSRPIGLCDERASVSRGVQGRLASRVVCEAAATDAPFKGDLLNKSYYPTSADVSNANKKWYVIDAQGQTLGRLATLAATYIRGKHLPTYSPSMDMGAFVVVVNSEKVEVSGTKFSDKTYFTQGINGRPSSHRIESFKDLQARIPERIIERAVKGMLPKGALGRDIRLHLKVFKGPAHTHEAQQPVDITSEISVKPKNSVGAKLREELLSKK